MFKKVYSLLFIVVLLLALSGCGNNDIKEKDSAADTVSTADADLSNTADADLSNTADADIRNTADADSFNTEDAANKMPVVRVGSLKGPTSMGLVNLMKKVENKETAVDYKFTMETQPDVLAAEFIKGDIDIALVPANMAAILYKKTEKNAVVIDVNTLGVLYCVTADESISSIKDLSNKTLITTGQGASPEYILKYLLEKNEITDCTLEFKSEASEIAAILKEDKNAIAVLPQPFVTVAEAQNPDLKTAFSLTDEWEKVDSNSQLLTGVTVVRKDFLMDNMDLVEDFLQEHMGSASAAENDTQNTANLVAEYGIIEKKQIAEKALPECNIVCITGKNMKRALEGYLSVLYNMDPSSVGGSLPQDDFYYVVE